MKLCISFTVFLFLTLFHCFRGNQLKFATKWCTVQDNFMLFTLHTISVMHVKFRKISDVHFIESRKVSIVSYLHVFILITSIQ